MSSSDKDIKQEYTAQNCAVLCSIIKQEYTAENSAEFPLLTQHYCSTDDKTVLYVIEGNYPQLQIHVHIYKSWTKWTKFHPLTREIDFYNQPYRNTDETRDSNEESVQYEATVYLSAIKESV